LVARRDDDRDRTAAELSSGATVSAVENGRSGVTAATWSHPTTCSTSAAPETCRPPRTTSTTSENSDEESEGSVTIDTPEIIEDVVLTAFGE
jgi:hypothetical protein